jgi:hypothetical protein
VLVWALRRLPPALPSAVLLRAPALYAIGAVAAYWSLLRVTVIVA